MNVNERSESRKHNRLEVWDYSEDGYYFVTACVENHREIFGKVEKDEMILNEFGKIVWEQWLWLAKQYKYIQLDEFIVMPNHFHGILIIDRSVGTGRDLSLQKTKIKSLSELIGAFKTTYSKRINQYCPSLKFQWQRSFYDHIIRGEKSLERIREYIRYNATKWELDRENPLNFQKL